MSCSRLLPLILAATLALPALSAAQPIPSNYKYASMSAALRNSFTIGKPGLDFRLGIGGFWGLFGVEMETGWTADRTWASPESRTAARTTTWLGPQIWLRPKERIAVTIGVAPGLGWIKDPADQSEPHPRYLSAGLREYVQVGFFIGAPLGFFQLGVRLEVQHLAQSAVIEGTEHAFCLRLVMAVGEVRPLDELEMRERPRRGR